MRQRTWSSVLGLAAVWVAVVGLVGLSACLEEYNFEHQVPERGSFGEEAWRVLRKDAALSPRDYEARSAQLDRDRDKIILALDATVPESLLRPLADFLLAIRHLYDNGLLPGLTRKIARVLDDVDASESLRRSWAEDNVSPLRGYKAPGTYSAFVEHAVFFPELKALNELLSRLALENDGFTDEGGFAPGEPEFMTELARAVSRTLTTQSVSGDKERVGLQLGDLLLSADQRFAPEGGGRPLEVVKLDGRGLPQVRSDARGRIYSPFADVDGDGLADVDEGGVFIDGAGRALSVAPYGEPNASGLVLRDDRGRAVAPDGDGFTFEYVNLHDTAASYLLQQNTRLVEEDVIFDLPDALQVVMPARQTLIDADTGQPYQGYGANQPLMHLVYGLAQVLDQEGLDELLNTSSTLLGEHPEVIAEVLLALEEFGDLSDMHPGAELAEGNTLVDDLAPVLARISAEKGLLADVLRAMRDPVTLRSEPAIIDLLNHKGAPAVPRADGPYNRCFGDCEGITEPGTRERIDCVRACPAGEIQLEAMDFGAPRSATNRSHFDRLLNMVRATNGVEFEMLVTSLSIPAIDAEYALGANILPPLLRIDNAAVAFLEAVLGRFRFVDFVTDEAIDHPQVELLLDGMGFICGTSFFGELIEAIIPILVNVTEGDLERTCQRFEQIEDQGGLAERERRRQLIAVLVSFLSLLTDVAMDEVPTSAQLTRFFNTPRPAVNLEIASLSLSELIDADGYPLWEADGDMLFASEATGALDALTPIIRAFSDHGQTVLLADLFSVASLHYPTEGFVARKKDGSPAPRAGRGTGISTFEELLRDWLQLGRLFPALNALALANADIVSNRGRAVDDVLEEAVRHVFVPDAALTHFDGRATSVRADGQAVSPLSRFYILADGLNAVADRVDADPQASQKWDRATEALLDTLIGVEATPEGAAAFKNPGSVALSQLLTAHIAERAALRRDRGTLDEFVQEDIIDEAEALLTGRGLPAGLDLFNAVNGNEADRTLFKRFLIHSVGTPEGAGHMLQKIYELLLDLTDEESFSISARFYGSMIDPDRDFGPTTSPLPMLSHGLLVLRENMAVDEEDVVLQLLRNTASRLSSLEAEDGDPGGAYPLSGIGLTIKNYHRVDPEATGPLSAEDYQTISAETRDWLLDDVRGMEQLYDMIDSRKKDAP